MCRHGAVSLEKKLLGRAWELVKREECGSALLAAPRGLAGVNLVAKPHCGSQRSHGRVATPSPSDPFASVRLCFNCSCPYITLEGKSVTIYQSCYFFPSGLFGCHEDETEHPIPSRQEAVLWNVLCCPCLSPDAPSRESAVALRPSSQIRSTPAHLSSLCIASAKR